MRTAIITVAAAALCLGCVCGADAQNDYTILHHFAWTPGNGTSPRGNLISDGTTLYGMTPYGGANNQGTVFSFDTAGSSFTLIHSFAGQPNDGSIPLGSLISDGSTLYGMTYYGGAGVGGSNYYGTVFSIGKDGTGHNILHDFTAISPEGGMPWGGLLADGSRLYGMTYGGGSALCLPYGCGTMFYYDRNTTAYSVFHHFNNLTQDGTNPTGDVILDGTTLYGMTRGNGQHGLGVIFSYELGGGSYSALHHFAGKPNDGATPRAGSLLQDNDTFYGMTHDGGASNLGVVFSIRRDPPHEYSVLHSFAGAPNDGAGPFESLLMHQGVLYGMTEKGGAKNKGAVFSLDRDSSKVSLLHSFAGAPNDGAEPWGGLCSDGSTLYGMTRYGGTNGAAKGYGVMFSLALPAQANNYINLTASPASVGPSGSASMGWSCDFGQWNYQNVPVNIYVAAIKSPKTVNAPSSIADALAGGEVWLAADRMTSWYRYSGSVGAPTWSGVVFPPAPTTGSKQVSAEPGVFSSGNWVFATAFVRADGSGPVRTDLPVENSNKFVIQ